VVDLFVSDDFSSSISAQFVPVLLAPFELFRPSNSISCHVSSFSASQLPILCLCFWPASSKEKEDNFLLLPFH